MNNYIVLDLEWNQSPDGIEGKEYNLPFEITEIGAVKLDSTFRVVDEFNRLVKPEIYTKLHHKISEVTHISMEELLKKGEKFPVVMRDFFEWCGPQPILCTWGSMDLTELQRNMKFYHMDNPFPIPFIYYDIQKLYGRYIGDVKDRSSLDHAVLAQNIKMERPFHCAIDDAWYTGKIMSLINFEEMKDYVSIDYYRIPETKEKEIYIEFPDYSKYISKLYDTREQALEDKDVTDMKCYKCHRLLKKKIKWFLANQKSYMGLAICPVHGYLKGKIRIKKDESGRVYIVKTQKLIGENAVSQLYQKRADIKLKRSKKKKNSNKYER